MAPSRRVGRTDTLANTPDRPVCLPVLLSLHEGTERGERVSAAFGVQLQ